MRIHRQLIAATQNPGLKYFVSFAEEMSRMPYKAKRIQSILSKLLAGFIYLSFFLVQFDIHFGETPQDFSYFSCDYNAVTEYQAAKHVRNFEVCKKATPIHFLLNKRFHPEKLFFAVSYQERIRPISILTASISFTLPNPILKDLSEPISRRGPPALV
jgi:hypothetical protein